ncbi:hypothetical protein [Rhizobium sp. PP-CC-3G-465]|uniref:hypothetical protein n=1 Tax=Rhizobium sp. PP-CC-3G-465 TaxID=2135648 RepID=UPI00104E6889|nr:hypothetical protein C8J33_101910 [Rhizobium sp. PP-CC-3G-465]
MNDVSESETKHMAETRKALLEDYKIALARWDDAAKTALTIKGWLVAGSAATLLTLAQSSLNEQRQWLSIALAAITVIVWFLEALWKSWQHAQFPTIWKIEAYFSGSYMETPQIHQLYSRWIGENGGEQFNWKRCFKEMKEPFVYIPYAPIIVILCINACL